MEVNTIQTQTAAIVPERPLKDTNAPAPETTESSAGNQSVATPAFEVTISEDARAAARNEQQAAAEEEPETQNIEPEVVQVYNNAARIGG